MVQILNFYNINMLMNLVVKMCQYLLRILASIFEKNIGLQISFLTKTLSAFGIGVMLASLNVLLHVPYSFWGDIFQKIGAFFKKKSFSDVLVYNCSQYSHIFFFLISVTGSNLPTFISDFIICVFSFFIAILAKGLSILLIKEPTFGLSLFF